MSRDCANFIFDYHRRLRFRLVAYAVSYFQLVLYYTGSVMNGLEQRTARHRRGSNRLFWHIDFLLEHPTVDLRLSLGMAVLMMGFMRSLVL